MSKRLGILFTVGLLFASILSPAALGFQELELQAATDALQTAGRTTVDTLFWRSGFGASVLGGPSYAGDTTAYNSRITEFENATGGTTPTGARPIFIEFASLAGPTYTNSSVVPSDYTTQRWNQTNATMTTGASALGLGAAADAAWASYLLRTNHWAANGTQDPNAPEIGATNDDGLLGLWLVQALDGRVSAIITSGAYNGSAITAFNLSDPALTDSDPSNGWQSVPDGLAVMLSTDPEPLFQGFGADNNATSLRGQAAVILGLAEVAELSDPTGAHAALFDSSPFDASLHFNSNALLYAVAMNAEAAHWDPVASAYTEAGGRVQTGDLAAYAEALVAAEKAVAISNKANVTAARDRAFASLTALADANGVFPGFYDVAGAIVTADWSVLTLWSQSAALSAISAMYGSTGLKAHYDWIFRASAGLESRLFYNGSYHAVDPEVAVSTFTASAIAATVAGQRDLALTGEEPLAIYRVVNATQWLFTAPPLTLAGAATPPVIGANFVWNATSESYESGGKDFDAAGALYASYVFLTVGPQFYAAVGGGVSVTERAALLLHNATAADVGAAVDALDAQIAALIAQVAAIQASFDTLNNSVTNITDRLSLSLENESISAQRIIDLQANVTALRASLNNTIHDLSDAQADLGNATGNYTQLQMRLNNVTNNLTTALQNATDLAGKLNGTLDQLQGLQQALNNADAAADAKGKEAGRAQQVVALAVVGGIVAGALIMLFLQRFVMNPKPEVPKEEEPKKSDKAKRDERDEDDEDNDRDDLK